MEGRQNSMREGKLMGCNVGGGRGITMGIVKRRSKGESVFCCRKIFASTASEARCA